METPGCVHALCGARSRHRRTWEGPFRPWVIVAIVVLVLALVTRPAAAQTARGTELSSVRWQRSRTTCGARIYRERCASCHGSTAHGSADPVTPALAEQQALYLIKQMVDFAEGDRTAPEMHRVVALKELSTPQAIRDVSSYLTCCPATGGPRPETARTSRRASASTKAYVRTAMANVAKGTNSTRRPRCRGNTTRTCSCSRGGSP